MQIDLPDPPPASKIWAAVLLLTLAAIAVVADVWLALLNVAPGWPANLAALSVGLGLAVAIGRVTRWLTRRP